MADTITSAEMAALRSEVQQWMSDVLSIVRITKTADQYGGQSLARTVIATGIPCDISAQAQAQRAEEVIGSQIEVRQLYTISLPPGTDIKVHDLVQITSWTPTREMVVQSVQVPESWETELSIYASLEGEPNV